jgi:hypothetical protein
MGSNTVSMETLALAVPDYFLFVLSNFQKTATNMSQAWTVTLEALLFQVQTFQMTVCMKQWLS